MNITTTNAEYTSYPNNEWIVDFVSEDNSDPRDELNTIIQAVKFALETERYKFPIMGGNYGTTFEDLIGTDYSFIKSEISRRIRDALSIDDRIIGIDEFKFTKSDDSDMLVECNIRTILGNFTFSTTIKS